MTKFKKFLYSDNFKSFIHTLITDILYDAVVGATFTQVITGDISKSSLYALGYAIFRTFLRAVREFVNSKFKKPVDTSLNP